MPMLPKFLVARAAVGADLIEADELEAEEDERPEDCAPRSRKGKASVRGREAGRSYAPYSASHATAPTMLATGGGEAKLPQVQMVQQAVSMDQTRRLVMQGLSRHAKVGPGGKLTPKGVWAKADGGEGGLSEGAVMEVDGSAGK
ncbi:hypothetical protein BKA70DRAFT_1350711 [Coprinopsis sp. MPI-PUGE-AT-0042]|nr:hypothetical protein BKA70DRAFT_1350711 [Coprinopsis sp. MPI-PUGE-AT-0042]